jgi:hypothetical protein
VSPLGASGGVCTAASAVARNNDELPGRANEWMSCVPPTIDAKAASRKTGVLRSICLRAIGSCRVLRQGSTSSLELVVIAANLSHERAGTIGAVRRAPSHAGSVVPQRH